MDWLMNVAGNDGALHLAKIIAIQEDGSVWIDWKDGNKPPRQLIAKDAFPWDHLGERLFEAWHLSQPTPRGVTLKGRLAADLLEAIAKIPPSERFTVIQKLRHKGLIG